MADATTRNERLIPLADSLLTSMRSADVITDDTLKDYVLRDISSSIYRILTEYTSNDQISLFALTRLIDKGFTVAEAIGMHYGD